jgi:hypothetical protein
LWSKVLILSINVSEKACKAYFSLKSKIPYSNFISVEKWIKLFDSLIFMQITLLFYNRIVELMKILYIVNFFFRQNCRTLSKMMFFLVLCTKYNLIIFSTNNIQCTQSSCFVSCFTITLTKDYWYKIQICNFKMKWRYYTLSIFFFRQNCRTLSKMINDPGWRL